MIKRLIFDMDNTLIPWKDEYLSAIRNTLKDNNSPHDYNAIDDLIESYENYYDHYDKELLLKYINENIPEPKITMHVLDEFLVNIGFMSDYDETVDKTLDYLSKKYELVVLTNWFKEPQAKRLEVAGFLKYFKEVIGGDIINKPLPEAFISAMGDCKPEECIMIGDSYECDALGAYKVGIKPIFLNPSGKANPMHFEEIKTFSELQTKL